MDVNGSSSRMFFFPDEGRPQEGGKPLPQVAKELGDIAYRSNKSSDTDEEFCIVGEEAGLGIMVSKHYISLPHEKNGTLRIFCDKLRFLCSLFCR